jgi:hypothetical protein
MKVYYYFHVTREEAERCMETAKHIGMVVSEVINDLKYIHVKYDKKIYRFDRFDKAFGECVEHLQETNPYKHCPGLIWEGCFHVANIDDRFINERYWSIKQNRGNNEHVLIHNEKIINDLFDKSYVYT